MKFIEWPKGTTEGSIPFWRTVLEEEVKVVELWLVDVNGLYYLLPSSVVENFKLEWEAIKKADGGKEFLPTPTVCLTHLLPISTEVANALLNDMFNHQKKDGED